VLHISCNMAPRIEGRLRLLTSAVCKSRIAKRSGARGRCDVLYRGNRNTGRDAGARYENDLQSNRAEVLRKRVPVLS
jgi:hypothetical protein